MSAIQVAFFMAVTVSNETARVSLKKTLVKRLFFYKTTQTQTHTQTHTHTHTHTHTRAHITHTAPHRYFRRIHISISGQRASETVAPQRYLENRNSDFFTNSNRPASETAAPQRCRLAAAPWS